MQVNCFCNNWGRNVLIYATFLLVRKHLLTFEAHLLETFLSDILIQKIYSFTIKLLTAFSGNIFSQEEIFCRRNFHGIHLLIFIKWNQQYLPICLYLFCVDYVFSLQTSRPVDFAAGYRKVFGKFVTKLQPTCLFQPPVY